LDCYDFECGIGYCDVEDEIEKIDKLDRLDRLDKLDKLDRLDRTDKLDNIKIIDYPSKLNYPLNSMLLKNHFFLSFTGSMYACT